MNPDAFARAMSLRNERKIFPKDHAENAAMAARRADIMAKVLVDLGSDRMLLVATRSFRLF